MPAEGVSAPKEGKHAVGIDVASGWDRNSILATDPRLSGDDCRSIWLAFWGGLENLVVNLQSI